MCQQICPPNAIDIPYKPIISCVQMRQPCQLYTLYELNTTNNVTRSTGILTFHITGICPWTNMPSKLHKYVPLHFFSLHIEPKLLHISVKNLYTAIFIYHFIAKYVQLRNILFIWQLPKLLDVHFMKEGCQYKYVPYEVNTINYIARINVHRCQQWCRTMIMMMLQPNYIYWVGHSKSFKNTENCSFYLPCYCHIYAKNKYAPQMSHMKISSHADTKQLCQYIYHIRIHCNQQSIWPEILVYTHFT